MIYFISYYIIAVIVFGIASRREQLKLNIFTFLALLFLTLPITLPTIIFFPYEEEECENKIKITIGTSITLQKIGR